MYLGMKRKGILMMNYQKCMSYGGLIIPKGFRVMKHVMKHVLFSQAFGGSRKLPPIPYIKGTLESAPYFRKLSNVDPIIM